jgi:hypothetical protein
MRPETAFPGGFEPGLNRMNESDQHRCRVACDELRQLRRHLQVVYGGVIVSATALNHQNADRDREIAQVLEHLVGERLAEQIERTSQLLNAMEARSALAAERMDEGEDSDGVREISLSTCNPGSYREGLACLAQLQAPIPAGSCHPHYVSCP